MDLANTGLLLMTSLFGLIELWFGVWLFPMFLLAMLIMMIVSIKGV